MLLFLRRRITNHMRYATTASPTTEAPAAIPPIALGLSDEVASGAEKVLGTSVAALNIEVDSAVDRDVWAVAVVIEIRTVVGTNADVDATTADVDKAVPELVVARSE